MIYAYNNLRITKDDVLTGDEELSVLGGGSFDQVFNIPAIAPSRRDTQIQKNLERLVSDFESSLQEGDIVVAYTIMAFSDHIYELPLAKISKFVEKGIRVVALLENFDSDSPDAKMLLECLPLITAVEESRRQAEVAYRMGWRRSSYGPLDYPYFEAFYDQYIHRKLTKFEFAMKLGVSRPTLDKLIDEYESSLPF